jgi:DNA-binding NarL/FixJ family response regulator
LLNTGHTSTPQRSNLLSGSGLDGVHAVAFAAYPIWLDAIARVLSGAGVRTVTAATRTDQVLELIEEIDASLLVIDGGGRDLLALLDHVREVRQQRPGIRVILLGDVDEIEVVEQAFEAGVFAYLLRTADPEDLAATVRQAFSSAIFLSSRIRKDGPRPARSLEGTPPLTRRELEILRLAAAGRSNAELARRLWVTEQTVKFHLSNVYRKLNVANRTEAAHWAREHGLLDADLHGDPDPVG